MYNIIKKLKSKGDTTQVTDDATQLHAFMDALARYAHIKCNLDENSNFSNLLPNYFKGELLCVEMKHPGTISLISKKAENLLQNISKADPSYSYVIKFLGAHMKICGQLNNGKDIKTQLKEYQDHEAVKKLSSLCENYKQHLKETIQAEVSNITGDRFGKITIDMLANDDNDDPLSFFQKIITNNKVIAIGLQKYNAVTEMLVCLNPKNDNANHGKALINFNEKFKKHAKVLAKNRDTKTKLFLKAISSVFLSLSVVGTVFIYNLWKSKGQRLNDDLTDVQPRLSK